MPIKAIIFDLDGTLVDTSIDITRALNYAIKPFGLHELNVSDTIRLVGEGIGRLVEKVLGEEKARHKADAIRRFLDFYSEHLTDFSRIYPDVRETLEKLGGYKKAVISNKKESLSVELLDRLNLLKYFEFVIGGDSTTEPKPSPVPVMHALSRLGIVAEECIMVGDSNYDIEAGKKAGLRTVSVTYGYRDRELLKSADFLIDRLSDLMPLISTMLDIEEKRREKRYPVPDVYQEYFDFKVEVGGEYVKAALLDFSDHGVRIKSPIPLDVDSIRNCVFSVPLSLTHEAAFEVRIKHCFEQSGSFVCGAEVESVKDAIWFRVARKVHDFISEKDYFRETGAEV